MNSRRNRLALVPLEDRTTPATASYNPVTQVLSVTAAQGDLLTVSAVAGKPAGYLAVTGPGQTSVFTSATSAQAVRSLVVTFGGVTTGGLTLDSTAKLGGSLTVFGATGQQSVTVAGTVGGDISYISVAMTKTQPSVLVPATDLFDLKPSAVVGGTVALALGAGSNTVQLEGGTIHGNLVVTGGPDQDQVQLFGGTNPVGGTDLVVNGFASFNLGVGTNSFTGMAAHVFRVGGAFVYLGGGGTDTVDLDAAGATLDVHGDARFTLGTPAVADSNVLNLEALNANNLVIVGGAGSDAVEVSGELTTTGSVVVALGDGNNSFDSNLNGNGTNLIGGGFTYLGGQDGDSVQLDNTTVGRNVAITLGAARNGATAFVGIGQKSPGGVTVYGSVGISNATSTAASGIFASRLFTGGDFAVTGGLGSDNVVMDDVTISGNTLLDLGAGDDFFNLEQNGSNTGGPLAGTSTFGGWVTFIGGAGNDSVLLTKTATVGSAADFGGRVVLAGGAGTDTLKVNGGSKFERTGNFTDFETVTGTLP